MFALGSALLISLVSLVGLTTLSVKLEHLKKVLLFLVSFSVGALFGDTFIHLLPEAVREAGFTLNISLFVLCGIIFFFVLEKFIFWRHCHVPTSDSHPHSFAYMNLIGDGFHNLIDGMIIAGTYVVNVELGVATTLAVILHEIPQEIGDFGVLIHAGYTREKALFFNFLSGVTALIGVIITLSLQVGVESITTVLVPFTAGGFIYIAGSDLIPELHRETSGKKSFLQFLGVMLGILVMLSLLFVG
jgi:zinc and cadmium transporter